jgi:hypothetical protein
MLSNSCAKRLRRDLFKAGVYRLPPIEVPAKKPGRRKDKSAELAKLAPHPHDPVYFENASTLPVDFHSFRRAFSTALAEAGTNVQLAMNLPAHSDPRVHARYLMKTRQMRATPDAALPQLPPASVILDGNRCVGRCLRGRRSRHQELGKRLRCEGNAA